MKTIKLLGCIFLLSVYSHAQVGVGTTSPNATLDITASNVSSPTANDGILIPRIDNFPTTNPTADQDGMMVFVTGNGTPAKGFYYWDQASTGWIKIDSGGKNTLDQAYDEGGSGAGKSIDASDGAVRIDGTDGLLVTGTVFSGNSIDTEITGAGARMFYNPNKAAFRAGYINGDQWDAINIGNYSVAMGSNTEAFGSASTALGIGTRATSESTALGAYTEALGNRSTVFGSGSTATGSVSTAFGQSTLASGSQSTAMGFNTEASGQNSLATGSSTVASGQNATAIGHNTDAIGDDSTAIGSFTEASGENSTAMGSNTEASAENTLATGHLSIASGMNSTATGTFTRAISFSEMTAGMYNSIYTANSTNSFDLSDRLFVIGNGDSNFNRSNALTIYKSGLMNINDAYDMPLTDGTTGQVMTTDGSGVVTFQDLPSVTDTDTQNTLDQAYDEGGAGTGKDITADNGAVTINGTDGILVTGTLGSGNTIDDEITGDGVRMFFNPNKAAYRGGMAEDDWWIDSRIGNYTFSHGRKTWVAGDYSVAFGRETTANGEYAFAGGWDNDANGDRSFVYGFVSGTSGDYAVSFGNGNQASGLHGFTQGASNTASGDYTMAFGRFNSSTGDHSKAIGLSLNAESYGETVFGLYDSNYSANSTTAFDANDRLFVVGNGTSNTNRSNALTIFKNGTVNINDAYNIPNTDGTNGQVMTTDGAGNVTFEDLPSVTDTDTQNTLDEAYDEGGPGAGRTINALDGAVEIAGEDGFQVTGTYGNGDSVLLSGAGTRLFFNPNKAAFRAGVITGNEWDDANIGNYSIALGYNTTASGFYSTAFGEDAVASNNASTAFGSGTTASGSRSTAFGEDTIASATTSTAFGDTTTASGSTSTAFGSGTTASGNLSVAFGTNTVASGNYSTAFGLSNTAGSYGETAIGLYSNTGSTFASNSFNALDQLFVVGNGTSNSDRSNALTIYKSGRMNINDAYNMPTTDGTTGQVMTTDGAGNVTFENISAGDTDWVVQSTSDQASALTDNLYTDGTVKIGGTNGPTGGAKLEVINTNGPGVLTVVNTSPTGASGIFNQNNVPNIDKILHSNQSIINNTGGTDSNLIGTQNVLISNVNGGTITGFHNDLSFGIPTADTFNGLYNEIGNLAGFADTRGIYNVFRNVNTTTYGIRNEHTVGGSFSFYGMYNLASGTSAFGSYNDFTSSTAYGSYTELTGTGAGSKYGHYVFINTSAGGDQYGIYTDVRSSTGYAGYLVGRTSLGVYPTVNRYIMPLEDGSAGQVMMTNGVGDVTFQDLPSFTDTDEQDLSSSVVTPNEEVEISITNGANTTINIQDADANASNELITSAVLSGTDLEITEAGSTTTVDLSAINSDEQDLSSTVTTPNEEVEISITNGTNTTINIQDADANASNELITSAVLSGTDLEITEAGSTTTVDLSSLQDGVGSDDQDIQNLSLSASNILTVGIENGTSDAVNLSSINTDNQNIENLSLNSSNILTVGIEDGSSDTVDLSSLKDADWYEVGTTNSPDAITDNIFTEGNVGIGTSTIGAHTTASQTLTIGPNDTTSSVDASYIELVGFATPNQTVAGIHFDSGIPTGDGIARIEARLNNTTQFAGHLLFLTGNSSGNLTEKMRIEDNGDIGIGITNPDTRLHVSGDFKLQNGSEALGRILSTNNQGLSSWVDPSTVFTDTDEQDLGSSIVTPNEAVEISITNGSNTTINIQDADANSSNELITAAVLNGTDLEITEAGATTSVDLSSLNPVKSVARITMSASQTETGAGTTKVNFDTVDFDTNSNFNTTADRFVVPTNGLYRVTTQITMDASTGTGIFAVRVRVNGTQERRSEFNHHGNGQVVRQVTSILNLTAGQTIDVSFTHPAIGATILANGRGTYFEIEQL